MLAQHPDPNIQRLPKPDRSMQDCTIHAASRAWQSTNSSDSSECTGSFGKCCLKLPPYPVDGHLISRWGAIFAWVGHSSQCAGACVHQYGLAHARPGCRRHVVSTPLQRLHTLLLRTKEVQVTRAGLGTQCMLAAVRLRHDPCDDRHSKASTRRQGQRRGVWPLARVHGHAGLEADLSVKLIAMQIGG